MVDEIEKILEEALAFTAILETDLWNVAGPYRGPADAVRPEGCI